MKSRAIHARIADQTYEELEFLKRDLDMKETTQVVAFALHHLFDERKRLRSAKSPFEAMEEFGLIGALKAPADLSETYKESLTKSLRKKHSLGKVHREK